jgi:hypothetical protein
MQYVLEILDPLVRRFLNNITGTLYMIPITIRLTRQTSKTIALRR